MADAGKAKGHSPASAQHGAKGAGEADVDKAFSEFDIADELRGDNSLQGRDQERAPSERQAQAGATGETDSLLESFKKMDKTYRAEADRKSAGRNDKSD